MSLSFQENAIKFINPYILLGVCLILLTASACSNKNESTHLKSIVIEVTGENFNWHFRYPGHDGVLGTDDDMFSLQDLYLPANSRVTLKLKSKDYIYSFALPELGKKEIAVPELDFTMQFKTEENGTLQILGDQFCGYAHKTLIGQAMIRNFDNNFYTW